MAAPSPSVRKLSRRKLLSDVNRVSKFGSKIEAPLGHLPIQGQTGHGGPGRGSQIGVREHISPYQIAGHRYRIHQAARVDGLIGVTG